MQKSKPTFYLSLHHLMVLFVLACISLSANSNNEVSLSETSANRWQAFNLTSVHQYILPAYKNLSQQSKVLLENVQQLCQPPINTEQKRQLAKASFHDTMDAWQFIQNIQFGPIQTFMRNYSMQFWPDKKNHVSKHLFQLLASKDSETLRDDNFYKTSVSIKGLPAIERFLFEEELNKTLAYETFNCEVLVRISEYTVQTTQSLVEEWLQFSLHFENTNQIDSYFEDDIDAATTLLKTLIEPIEVIRDLKLLRPLGSRFGQQKPKRLESWRSLRSLRNIKMNIESLAEFYSGASVKNKIESMHLYDMIAQDEAEAIRLQFENIIKQIDSIPSPIVESIDTEEGYRLLTHLSNSLKVLHELLEEAVNNQGIHLGFNSRDGD